MKEIVRTNDAVLVSAIEALFAGARIPLLVLDQNMSVLEGSLGIRPRPALPGSRAALAGRVLVIAPSGG